MRRVKSIGIFLTWLLIVAAIAMVGVRYRPGIWYETLAKPFWTPPNWLFPPVWFSLYFLMTLAATRVTLTGARRPLLIFFLQLILNGAWSWLFFGLHLPIVGLLDLVALVPLVAWCTQLFFENDRVAGYLLLPYLCWISYALTLNVGIVFLL